MSRILKIKLNQLSYLCVMMLSILCFSSFTAWAEAVRVGLVLDKGGKDDKSFNASAYQGLLRAKEQFKIEVKHVDATDNNAFESVLRKFGKEKYDLVIAIGIAQAEAVKKVAPQFPQQKFAIVDAEVNLPNVRSLLFQEHEGSYLVGALAAMASKTGTVGFIGGMDIPLIRRFEKGFEAGAKAVNPKAKLVSNYVGTTSDAWSNPPRAKELALAQFSTGADVVFAAAGGSGQGLFDAVEEKKKLAIGVDSNQNWIKPGQILTSMLKRVDVAVFETCRSVVEKKFTAGVQRFGLFNGGVDYALDEHNQKLVTPEMKKKVDALKSDIIQGKVTVPDYYLTQGK